jgi:post-segregation antitoxin (ccd killing protein)
MGKNTDYQYIIRKEILINKIQNDSLNILKKYDINISQFIRSAISEKIKRDWRQIKLKKQNNLIF